MRPFTLLFNALDVKKLQKNTVTLIGKLSHLPAY